MSLATRAAGSVFSWGAGSGGVLGHGRQSAANVTHPKFIAALRDHRVVSTASGALHSLALTEAGEVVAWGTGAAGQLGLEALSAAHVPQAVAGLLHVHVVAVACGDAHSAALSDTGVVFAWGRGDRGQLGSGVPADSAVPVVAGNGAAPAFERVVCGPDNTFAITGEGVLHSWGCGERCRLGTASADDVLVPVAVDALRVPVADVACGDLYAVAASVLGRAFFWGEDCRTPELLRCMRGRQVRSVCSGRMHVVVLTDGGDVLYWRWGQRCPHLAVMDQRVVQVASGWEHFAAVTADGRLFTWGASGDGRLGHRSERVVSCSPDHRALGPFCDVPAVVSSLSHLHVVHASCGSSYTLAVTRPGPQRQCSESPSLEYEDPTTGDWSLSGDTLSLRRTDPMPDRSSPAAPAPACWRSQQLDLDSTESSGDEDKEDEDERQTRKQTCQACEDYLLLLEQERERRMAAESNSERLQEMLNALKAPRSAGKRGTRDASTSTEAEMSATEDYEAAPEGVGYELRQQQIATILSEQLSKEKRSLEDLRQNEFRMKKALVSAQEQLKKEQRDAEELGGQIRATKERICILRQGQSEMEAEGTQLRTDLEKLEGEMDKERQQYAADKERVFAVRREIDKLHAKSDKMLQDRHEAEKQLIAEARAQARTKEDCQADVLEKEAELEALREESNALQLKVAQLTAQAASSRDEITGSKKRLSTLREQIQQQTAQLEQATREQTQLEHKLKALSESTKRVREDREATRESLKKAQEQAEQATSERDELRRKLEDVQSSGRSAKDQVDRAQWELGRESRQLEDALRRLKQVKSAVDERRIQLHEAEARLRDLAAEHDTLGALLAASQEKERTLSASAARKRTQAVFATKSVTPADSTRAATADVGDQTVSYSSEEIFPDDHLQ
eukprot:m51a1_g1951 hypothetical protein (908) ;mRNA; f:1008840-1012620